MTSTAPALFEFDTGAQLVTALAGKIAGHLRAAIAERGRATLAVSGGRTPAALFSTLARLPLAWEKVMVTLCDERWVSNRMRKDDVTMNSSFCAVWLKNCSPCQGVPLQQVY